MTRTSTPEQRRESFVEELRSAVRMAERTLEKFAADFAGDPMHALKWSRDVFTAAAVKAVFTRVLRGMETHVDYTPEAVVTEARETVFRMASDSSRSTSPTSNLCDDSERLAWCKLAETGRYL